MQQNNKAKQDLIDKIKKNLSLMENKMSFLIQGADGTIYVKEHLSTAGTQPYDDNSTIHIASGCKWIAMATIMRLVELNILSLDDKVIKYYPSFSKSNPGLKLLHLMTHTSGYHLADDWVFDNDITLQQSVNGITNGGLYPASKLNFQGGKKVGYSDLGMQIAGGIAELATGKSFQQLFQEFIAKPLNMINAQFTAFDGVIKTNIAIADGLLIRMIDYGNFLRMLLNNGTHEGKVILQPKTIEIMLQDYTGDLPVEKKIMKEALGDEIDESCSFAIGSWIYETHNNEPTVFASAGIHGFENWIDVENKYLCIFYLRTDPDKEPEISELSESMRPAILKYYLNQKKGK